MIKCQGVAVKNNLLYPVDFFNKYNYNIIKVKIKR